MKCLLLLIWIVAAQPALAEDGARLYTRECAGCHLADGSGAPGLVPPLRGRIASFARETTGRAYLAGVMNFGLEGRIEVDGTTYDDYMPAIAMLSPIQKAAVLNYLIGTAPGVRPFGAAELAPSGSLTPEAVRSLRPTTKSNSKLGIPRTADDPDRTAMLDYARHCQGCHTPTGDAVADGVPALRGQLGDLLHTAAGRAYVIQVPGVALAPLDGGRLAAVLNWVARSFSARELPRPFVPFTASEVSTYRRVVLNDVEHVRRNLIRQLPKRVQSLPDIGDLIEVGNRPGNAGLSPAT